MNIDFPQQDNPHGLARSGVEPWFLSPEELEADRARFIATLRELVDGFDDRIDRLDVRGRLDF